MLSNVGSDLHIGLINAQVRFYQIQSVNFYQFLTLIKCTTCFKTA